jgi:hypothetical protein
MGLQAIGRGPLRPLAFVAFVIASLSGCDRGANGGTVSGRVLVDGKPLRGGTITFVPTEAGSKIAGCQIEESGNFGPVTLSLGEVLVSVDNRSLAPRQSGGQIALPKNLNAEARAKILESRAHAAPSSPANPNYMAIPSRYYLVETSGLTLKIERGDQAHDIELKSK